MIGPRLIEIIEMPDGTLWSTDGETNYVPFAADDREVHDKLRSTQAELSELLSRVHLQDGKLNRERDAYEKSLTDTQAALGKARAELIAIKKLASAFVEDFDKRVRSLPGTHADAAPCLRVASAFRDFVERIERGDLEVGDAER